MRRAQNAYGVDVPSRKCNVLGVLIDATTYEEAVERICKAATGSVPFPVTALAVHGVMEGYREPTHKYRLNRFSLVVPDGQPVRWFLNFRYKTHLHDRVYGPELMLRVCRKAASNDLPVYLYGSSAVTVERLGKKLRELVPGLTIAGVEPSKFRRLTRVERDVAVERLRTSGAKVTFVGMGCPRQEVFAYELAEMLRMPVIAVGAAFDYHAGLLREPPLLIQNMGLQWLYRLCQDPKRLWHRYLILNTQFAVMTVLQCLQISEPSPFDCEPPPTDMLYG